MLHIYKSDRPDYKDCVGYIQSVVKQGIKLDVDYLNDQIYELEPSVNVQREIIENKFGINNINSNVQIKNKFMQIYSGNLDALNVCKTYNKKSKDLQYSFNKEGLEALVENNNDELADGILKYREKSQLLKSLNSLLELSMRNGMVYPDVNVGDTGRISYSNPALTSINKDIVWDILSPSKFGNALYIIDISQQEPWILMHWFDIEQLKELVEKDPEKDFYNAVSVAALGEKASGDARSEVKRIWNALTYGASAKTLIKYGKHIDATKIIDYFNSIEEISEYKAMCKKAIYKDGEDTVDTYFGRTLPVVDYDKQSRLRKMLNYRIQGTAADIMVFLVNYLRDEIEERGLEDLVKLKYTIYDAIVLEVSGDMYTDDVIEFFNDIFRHQIDDWLEFKFTVKRAK